MMLPIQLRHPLQDQFSCFVGFYEGSFTHKFQGKKIPIPPAARSSGRIIVSATDSSYSPKNPDATSSSQPPPQIRLPVPRRQEPPPWKQAIRLQAVGPPAAVARELMARMDIAAKNRTDRISPALARPTAAKAAAPWMGRQRAMLPKNLSSYRYLPDLLDVFETIVPANEAGELAATDAVAALNHLKRLRRQAGGGDGRLVARSDACMRSFAATARRGLASMSAKNVALAMNSLADLGPGYAGFIADAAARVRELCGSNHEFHTQELNPPSHCTRIHPHAFLCAFRRAAAVVSPSSHSLISPSPTEASLPAHPSPAPCYPPPSLPPSLPPFLPPALSFLPRSLVPSFSLSLSPPAYLAPPRSPPRAGGVGSRWP